MVDHPHCCPDVSCEVRGSWVSCVRCYFHWTRKGKTRTQEGHEYLPVHLAKSESRAQNDGYAVNEFEGEVVALVAMWCG